MKFGLSETQYKFVFEKLVRPLHLLGSKVFCYGSRARGDFGKFSDLDLMVEGGSATSSEVGEILELFQNSNFPFKLDLVLYSEFADSYKEKYNKEKIEFISL